MTYNQINTNCGYLGCIRVDIANKSIRTSIWSVAGAENGVRHVRSGLANRLDKRIRILTRHLRVATVS